MRKTRRHLWRAVLTVCHMGDLEKGPNLEMARLATEVRDGWHGAQCVSHEPACYECYLVKCPPTLGTAGSSRFISAKSRFWQSTLASVRLHTPDVRRLSESADLFVEKIVTQWHIQSDTCHFLTHACGRAHLRVVWCCRQGTFDAIRTSVLREIALKSIDSLAVYLVS